MLDRHFGKRTLHTHSLQVYLLLSKHQYDYNRACFHIVSLSCPDHSDAHPVAYPWSRKVNECIQSTISHSGSSQLLRLAAFLPGQNLLFLDVEGQMKWPSASKSNGADQWVSLSYCILCALQEESRKCVFKQTQGTKCPTSASYLYFSGIPWHPLTVCQLWSLLNSLPRSSDYQRPRESNFKGLVIRHTNYLKYLVIFKI